jgi:hypothetical protein
VGGRCAARHAAAGPALELHHRADLRRPAAHRDAKRAGTSVAMLDKHYAGVIANWDGVPIAPEEQIRRTSAATDVDGRERIAG